MSLDAQGMAQCVNISDEMINKTTSVMYQKNPVYDTPVNGVWKQVASMSGGSTTYTITLSTTSEDDETSTESMESTMTSEMKEGVIFAGTTLSASVTASIVGTTSSTLA